MDGPSPLIFGEKLKGERDKKDLFPQMRTKSQVCPIRDDVPEKSFSEL